MTDDELDRALFALPLEEPLAGLRERILAATVYQIPVSSPFKTWELWLLGVVLAAVAFVTFTLFSSVPDLGSRAQVTFVESMHSFGLFKPATYAWFAVGLSAVWAISSLPLMPPVRQRVYNR
jgi:hypothetical protein